MRGVYGLILLGLLSLATAQDAIDILDAACLADIVELGNKFMTQNQTFTA